jgi:DNA-binding transcriptional LysR family regulator
MPTLLLPFAMRPLKVTLEGFLALVTVAQEGSLERGGDVLGMSRSTMGRHISTLEQAVGTVLFEQRRGRWVLNREGQILAPKALESILLARMGVDLVQEQVRLRTDHFAVGYSTYLSPLLIGMIKQIQLKRRGDVQIEYQSQFTKSAVEGVLRGELDVGFGYLPIREPDLLVRKVFEERLMVCMAEGHALQAGQSVPPAMLEGLPMIAVGRHALPLRFEETKNHFLSMGITLRFVEDCLSFSEALASVARGTGVCLLPTSLARSGNGVVVRPLEDYVFTYKSGVFVRQENSEDATIKNFLDLVLLRTKPYRRSRSHHR